MIRIAIVTVLYNSMPVLPDFLASLARQTGDWLLIAVDNASTDAGAAVVEAWAGPRMVIRNASNVGFAAATNQGIAHARDAGFDAVLLLNNDTSFDGNLMSGLTQAAAQAPGTMLAPVVFYHDAPERIWYAGGGFTWRRGALQAHASETLPAGDAPSWPADFAPGCAFLVPMAVFDAVGLLDERFFVYWEDADFCWRCRQAGVPLRVLRTPTLLHKVSTLTEGETSPFSIRMYQRGQVRFLRKHLGRAATLAQAPLLFAKALNRWLARREPWRATRLRLGAVAEALRDRG